MTVNMTTRLRYSYLNACKQNGVSPSVSFLNQFRECIEKKKPLHRVSITHGSYGDGQIAPVIATLKLSPSITDLALNYVDLTDQGCCELLRFLAKQGNVTSLELFGNKIGNSSCTFIPPLLNLQMLTRLKLGDNTITAAGACFIAKGLRNQHSLIQLHLGGNNIGDEGLTAIVDALHCNSTLTSLGIRDNGVGALGIKALVQLLQQEDCVLSEVQLKGNSIGDEGAEYLACAMLKNRTMRVLEVQSNNVGPRGAALLCNALHNNTTVHAINFNDNALSDEGAEAVAALLMNNTCITTVGISGNSIEKRGTNAIAKALACNNTLTGIDLGNNRLGNSGIITLANVLKDQNTTLMSLDVHLNNVNLQGIFALTQALLANTSLRHLDCGSNYSRNQGAHAWAKVIRKSTTLTRLCLTDNEIGREGGESLLQAMKFNTTLRNFQFGGQSQMHPLANRITPATRRSINSIVAKNKHTWEESQLHGAETPSWGTMQQPSVVCDEYNTMPQVNEDVDDMDEAQGTSFVGPLGRFNEIPTKGSHDFGTHKCQSASNSWGSKAPTGLFSAYEFGQFATDQMEDPKDSNEEQLTSWPCERNSDYPQVFGLKSRASTFADIPGNFPGCGSRLSHYIDGVAPKGHASGAAASPWQKPSGDAFEHEQRSGSVQGLDTKVETLSPWNQFNGHPQYPAGSQGHSKPWAACETRPGIRLTRSMDSSPYSAYHSSVGSPEGDSREESPTIQTTYHQKMDGMHPMFHSDWRLPHLELSAASPIQSPKVASAWGCMGNVSALVQQPSCLEAMETSCITGSKEFLNKEPCTLLNGVNDDTTLRTVMAALASLGMDSAKDLTYHPSDVASIPKLATQA